MSQGSAYIQRQGRNATSGDYYDYISKLSRTPSVIHGAPQYPIVHKAFNNKGIQDEEATEVRQDNVNRKNPGRSSKKVQVTDQVQFIDQNGNRKSEGNEEDVDGEAESFIQKQKGFELCKWKTFKFP
ncbi:hypothetical protein SADUNF_Sadunf12G0065400 [Salix dunnii]|uniref:Uncharacterized protein n=1 Tax=Salix dunnii TaxID=1413687 RepID=A0A835JIU6_9ROSI|nr:hypothetical protein SADUNF_Sadunf12G0065400 [Salix dunnii]